MDMNEMNHYFVLFFRGNKNFLKVDIDDKTNILKLK